MFIFVCDSANYLYQKYDIDFYHLEYKFSKKNVKLRHFSTGISFVGFKNGTWHIGYRF